MNVARPLGADEIDKSLEVELAGSFQELARANGAAFRQGETIEEGEVSTENLTAQLRRVSEGSAREVDNLIADLQALRRKLNSDGNRIQREIAEYSELNRHVMQLTGIISESVKNLPAATGRSPAAAA
jgi:hypothetical protein